MKKFLSIALSVALSAALLTGCGGGASTPTPASSAAPQASPSAAAPASSADAKSQQVTLTFWNMFTGGDGDYMNEMVQAFMKENPNIKIDVLPMLEADYYTKLPSSMAVKEAPDIAIIHASRLTDISRIENAFHELDSYDIPWGDYAPGLVESTIFDGKHVAIPLDTHPMIMYYNKRLLSESGLLKADGTPDLGEGIDGFRNALKQIKDKTPEDIIPLAASNLSTNFATWVWWVLYNQQNGEFTTPDGMSAAFDNEKGLKAVQTMYDLTYTDKTWPEGIKSGQEQFAAGKAAIAFAGVWTVGMVTDSGVDFGIMPIPKLFDRQITWGDSHTLVIPTQKNSDNYEYAVQFANWCSQNAYPWARAGHIPANTKVANSDEVKKLPHRDEYVHAKEMVVFYPQNPNILGAIKAIRAQLESMQTGQSSPQDTLKAMSTDVSKALSE